MHTSKFRRTYTFRSSIPCITAVVYFYVVTCENLVFCLCLPACRRRRRRVLSEEIEIDALRTVQLVVAAAVYHGIYLAVGPTQMQESSVVFFRN